MADFDAAREPLAFGISTRLVVHVVGRGIERRHSLTIGCNRRVIDRAAEDVLSTSPLAEHGTRRCRNTMNSWLRSPPIGPVSARIGIAFSPMRAKVQMATNILL